MTKKTESVILVDETAPNLESLAAKYSHESHGVYFTMLKRAIENQPEIRNIALAGTYGTGKSSILRHVRDSFDGRVIELSLLTLGAEPERATTSEDVNPAAGSKTNRIQKEIVKQLLYQQRPTDAPESRFRRISRFRWGRELILALSVAVLGLALAGVIGIDVATAPSFGFTFADRPHAVRVVAAYVGGALLLGAVVLGLRSLFRGRAGVEKLNAGPATITLPPRSTSYFDEYLDEIIYFFEMNSEIDIVVIEDLDRFNDPHIFESLRSLNGLLNAARQLKEKKRDGKERSIRFIYAVRDSVFGAQGRDDLEGTEDEAGTELARANRTKFFELIIPVVPFITHKNAREVMAELLKERGHHISRDLLDVAARHLADMRLVRNVINEYEVFKHRLLDVQSPVPELDRDRLFAMVLYKNVHMEEFENIRLGTSKLDALWDQWRKLVKANTDTLRADSMERQRRINERAASSDHARNLGRRVRESIDALASAPGTSFRSSELQLDGEVVTDDTLATPAFWRRFLEANGSLTAQVIHANSSRVGPMRFTLEGIEKLTGMAVNPDDFIAEESDKDRAVIDRNAADANFLRRHSWEAIAAKPAFVHVSDDARARSFRDWAEHILRSPLAVDLVVNGFITSYFSLHVSAFYGQLVRPDAMIYVMRYVDADTADADYSLTPDDVDAILRDQGRTVLSERSMLNVSIVDHLLRTAPDDAATVIGNLHGFDPEHVFFDRYFTAGREKGAFVAQAALVTPEIFDLLLASTALEHAEKIELVDIAARHRNDDIEYDYPSSLPAFIEENALSFPTLASGANDVAVHAVVDFIELSQAVIPDITGLPKMVITAFRPTRAYTLTQPNLSAVIGTDDLSLDNVRAADERALWYVLDHFDEYLPLFARSSDTPFTVTSRALFLEVLSNVVWGEDYFLPFIKGAGSEALVDVLANYPAAAWTALVAYGHAPMTWENVYAYVDHFGSVTEGLAHALAAVNGISHVDEVSQLTRAGVALAVLNSDSEKLDGAKRAALALSLEPGVLDVNNINPLAGSLVGDLIEKGLIVDGPEAFSSRMMVDWGTQAHAMRRSTQFASFLGAQTLQAKFVVFMLEDDTFSHLFPYFMAALRQYTGQLPRGFEALANRAIAGDLELSGADIAQMQAGGLRKEKAVEVLAASASRVLPDELRAILGRMGGAWAKVAQRGFGTHSVRATPGAEDVLERLRREGIVSKMPRVGSEFKVSLRQPGSDLPPRVV